MPKVRLKKGTETIEVGRSDRTIWQRGVSGLGGVPDTSAMVFSAGATHPIIFDGVHPRYLAVPGLQTLMDS